MVSRGDRYSMKGEEMLSGTMRWFGRNFRASGFGVDSVWMKIVRAPEGSARKMLFEGACVRKLGRAVWDRFGSRDAVANPRVARGAAARGSTRLAARRRVCPLEAIVDLNPLYRTSVSKYVDEK